MANRSRANDVLTSRRLLDESSSMSSLTSGSTTATTSSSMSSSTCGDMDHLMGQLAVKGSPERSPAKGRRSGRDKGRPEPQGVQAHTVVKCSPRKHGTKKSDICMQTENVSAISMGHPTAGPNEGPSSNYNWKKYLGDTAQHRPMSAGPQAKVAIVSSVQSSDESNQKRSPRNSSVYSVNGSGRAVAVIRANPSATTGRIGKPGAGSSVRASANKIDSPNKTGIQNGAGNRHYPSEIYSDTECMNGSNKSYPFCLTSQVLHSQAHLSGSSIYSDTRDSRLSSIYGQVCTPWMLQRQAAMAANGQVGPPGSPYAHVTSQRNAMTEAESMESLASLANGRASALKSEMGHLGSPGKHGVHSLMSGRKPRIHAASPSMRSGLRSAKDVDGDIFSSSLSLMSNASGVMVHGEDRHSQEIRKLRRELDSSNDKVVTLTSQLTTNAHMVAAFEQSLLAMTSRLQQQTALSERKESELNMLKMLVDELNECRKQNGGGDGSRVPGSLSPGRGHHHRDHGHHKDKRKDKAARKGALIRRHTFALASEELAAPPCGKKQGKLLDRNCQTPDQGDTTGGNKPTGWLRSSLSRAFRKSPKTPSSGNMVTSPTTPVKLRSGSCCELQNGAGGSLPSSPAHSRSGHMLVSPEDQLIEKLRQQLTEKERQVTELRLEALTSAHQLDSLNETLGELRRQLGRLTLENDRLRSLVTPSGVTLTPSNSTHSSNSTSSKVQNNSLDDNNAS